MEKTDFIRQADAEDLDAILLIYAQARAYMKQSGNPSQWGDTYPSETLIRQDIKDGQLYVGGTKDVIHFAFVFFLDPEPDYAVIKQGSWINAEPYGTIHRVASDGKIRGVFGKCLEFCKKKNANIRMDTHKENHTMQHVLEKHGFVPCGIVQVRDGGERLAYQFSADLKPESE